MGPLPSNHGDKDEEENALDDAKDNGDDEEDDKSFRESPLIKSPAKFGGGTPITPPPTNESINKPAPSSELDDEKGGSRDVNRTNATLMVNGQQLTFTNREMVTGKTLYFILVACIIVIVGGLAWTIADLLQPHNKLIVFLGLPFGGIIAIIGAGLFVLFFILISFYRRYWRGTYAITKILYTAKRLYQQMKIQTLAKVMTGGLMVAILLVTAGIAALAIQLVFVGSSQSAMAKFLASLSDGEWVLLISGFAFAFTAIGIAFAWLWNVGNTFFARRLLKT